MNAPGKMVSAAVVQPGMQPGPTGLAHLFTQPGQVQAGRQAVMNGNEQMFGDALARSLMNAGVMPGRR